MKRVGVILLLLLLVCGGWFLLMPARHTAHVLTGGQPLTNMPPPAAMTGAAIPQDETFNAITATNLEQWKMMVKGLRYSDTFGNTNSNGWKSWVMEKHGMDASIPIKLVVNGQVLLYNANFIDVDALISDGEIQSVKLHSPKMNIDETRTLGLQLCKMLDIDPKEFLAWSDKVGNHWLDAPLYSNGGAAFGFGIYMTYNDKKPWYVILIINHHS